jgi:outer membrane lipase/esterase
MKSWKLLGVAAAAALMLAACGGGGGETVSTGSGVTAVKVFGDSLADSGVFGIKFTVNAAGAGGASTPIWPERVAGNYGKTVCNFFKASGPTTFLAPDTACGSFAVGGGRINSLANTGGPSTAYSIPFQMDAAASVGPFAAGDLVLVDGGGNDAADLFGAFLGAQANPAVYQGMLGTLLAPATLNAVLPQPNGGALAGGLYMQALADKMADAITTKLIDKGATRVVVVNTPAITNTPRFKAVLAGVAAQAGAATATQMEGMAKGWVEAFNAQLNARFSGNVKVGIADLYTEFNNQVSNPAQFSLTNVSTPACPAVGTDAQGLPDYSFPTCTAAALDASGPAGWRSYAFSDGFHPTPYGHQLLAQLVSKTLLVKGWI